MARPIVAIVGRPNVGKSTLFNRLAGQRLAIVEDLPGTTRDRLYTDIEWKNAALTLVDTGGLWPVAEKEMDTLVRLQVEEAAEEADIILFLVDVVAGVLPDDHVIANWLRRSSKPVLLVANKADNPRRRDEAAVFYELGLEEVLPISAHHGSGIRDVLDRVLEALPSIPEAEEVSTLPSVAIVGRPNSGKSSLLNAMLGQERAIVADQPGTTRDALDTIVTWEGEELVLIDTAGIRRRGKIEAGIEYYGSLRALRAIQRADVGLLILDAEEGITAQDTHIAGYLRDAVKGAIILVNKWDLVATKDWKTPQKEWEADVRQRFRFMDYAPIMFISARYKRGIRGILPAALLVYNKRQERVSTGTLNQMLEKALAAHAPPSRKGRQLKIHYVTQAETRPPTFVFFVNDKNLVHFSYQRYLENQLRRVFGFEGTPIRMVFKDRRKAE